MVQKYYLSTLMKVVMIVAFSFIILPTIVLVFLSQVTTVNITIVWSFVISDFLLILVLIWRLATPLIVLSETGIKINAPFLFKTNKARWDEIEGMIVGELITFGFRERNIKLILRSETGTTKEISVSFLAVERPDEIIAAMKERIPEKTIDDIMDVAVLRKQMSGTLLYKNLKFTDRGISRGKGILPWARIKGIYYQGFVIAGYGSTTVTYLDERDKEKSFIIRPAISEDYLDVIRYLVQHAKGASIDTSLIRALEYTTRDARIDMLSMLFTAGSIAFMYIAAAMLLYYAPTERSGLLYILLLIPFGFIPLVMASFTLAGRFRGENKPASKKLLWSSMASFGPVLSIIIMFMTIPFSYFWFAGDLYYKAGDMNKTEEYYFRALDAFPESIDIPYELGKLYRERAQWDKAFEYLTVAYEMDPAYWGPAAVILAPDTLMKMGKYDEALDLCKKILDDHPKEKSIRRAISKKQDEIRRERDLYQR